MCFRDSWKCSTIWIGWQSSATQRPKPFGSLSRQFLRTPQLVVHRIIPASTHISPACLQVDHEKLVKRLDGEQMTSGVNHISQLNACERRKWDLGVVAAVILVVLFLRPSTEWNDFRLVTLHKMTLMVFNTMEMHRLKEQSHVTRSALYAFGRAPKTFRLLSVTSTVSALPVSRGCGEYRFSWEDEGVLRTPRHALQHCVSEDIVTSSKHPFRGLTSISSTSSGMPYIWVQTSGKF